MDELLIVDPQERIVHRLGLGADGEYGPMELSGLIELGVGELADRIDCPESVPAGGPRSGDPTANRTGCST